MPSLAEDEVGSDDDEAREPRDGEGGEHLDGSHRRPVRGALLVAPSDVEAATYPRGPVGFAPMPLERVPFESTVVASTDDPYVSYERAEHFAQRWGSRFVGVGPGGHINSASGLGGWPAGLELLRELAARGDGLVLV